MKKLRWISLLIVVVLMTWFSYTVWKSSEKKSEQVDKPITSEPESTGTLSTKGYVYDYKLGYGFIQPEGWEWNVFEEGFPDKSIKKDVIFVKPFVKKSEGNKIESQGMVQIELIIKSAASLLDVVTEFKDYLEISGVPILKETTIIVNDREGYDVLSGINHWNLRQVMFFNNEKAYVFSYQSQEEFFKMYEEIFNSIISSFELK